MQLDNKDNEMDLTDELYQTRRVTSPALEEIIYKPIKVLDHGFIRLIDYMGADEAIVQAARVSYGKGTKKVSQDRGLIFYLMRHYHTTPFEMCEIKFHIKLPIFVARQWIRHRTANVNEYSARYSILSKEFYIPEAGHISPQSKQNNQGRSEAPVSAEFARKVQDILRSDAEQCYRNYIDLLNSDEAGNVLNPNKEGIARELARTNLNLNFYTEWYWKTDLHNLLHFLYLRADPHAQYEIRVYADAIMDVVRKWVPLAAEAFEEYRLHGLSLSNKAQHVIRSMLQGKNVTFEESGLSKREWDETIEKLKSSGK